MSFQPDPYKKAVDATAIFTETDLSGAITYVNERFCALSGYSANELLGQNHRILKSGHHSGEFYAEMWRVLSAQGIWNGDICNRRKDGSLYWVSSTMVALTDPVTGLVKGYAAIRFDVTERYELVGKLKTLAYYDSLTGLPNRAALQACFDDFAQHAVARHQDHALCIVDIDRFGDINEAHGHDVGDMVLRQIGLRAQAFLADSTARVFHWGGDEFVVLFKDWHQQEDLLVWVERLIDHLAQPIPLHGGALCVTCSAGVSEFKADRSSPDLLLRHSNLALYKAKSLGPKRVVCYGKDEFLLERQNEMLQRELRQAMKSGDLQVYYQPKLDLRSGLVLGAEALLRWIHPLNGMVPPLEFLPRIENLPVALEIDQWVLEQALQFLQENFEKNPAFCVSVNISARQFQSRDFPSRLKGILDKYPDVGFQQLELEILESTAIEDFVQVNLNINAIKSMGVGVALDDFGVGYSSLAYLKKISPQTIKIDKTFILGILVNDDDFILTQSIINLTSSFDFGVVAEGVETVEHMMLLSRLGCSVVQGYGVLKPVAQDAFVAWLHQHQASDLGAGQWRPQWDLKHRYLLAAKRFYEHVRTLKSPALSLPGHGLEGAHALDLWAKEIGNSNYGNDQEFLGLMHLHRSFVAGLDAERVPPLETASTAEFCETQKVSGAEICKRVQQLFERIFWLPAGRAGLGTTITV
jgi:diguanylate cyclase (GGDEF)-like protein/PAS domain S-box-containing protein